MCRTAQEQDKNTRNNNMRMLSPRRRDTIKISLRKITAAAVIIYGFTTVLFIKSTNVVADRDAYLQEKYLLQQLKSRRKGGLFGRKKTAVDNDPAVKYQRQQQRSRNPDSSLVVLLLICLAVLWLFGVSADTVIVCISGICSQISEMTGSFAQQHNNETSRRRRDRNNNSNNNNNGTSKSKNNIRRKANANNVQSSLQNRNASDDNSISPSVLEIIDMETIVDDSPKPRGILSSIFDAMVKGRKNLLSSSKQKNVPDNNRQNGKYRQSSNSSSSRNGKSHRDKSSLRLRASSKQSSIQKDEELGDDDESNIAIPGFLNSIEEDEYSDNGTAFAIGSPEMTPSPKREKHSHVNGHSHTKKKTKSSPLKKKLSDGMEGEKKSSHNHSSRRRKHHH